MLDDFLKEFDGLAPYLKEKLINDNKHTWQDAPYIHEDVKESIRKYMPASSSYKYEPFNLIGSDVLDRILRDQVQSTKSQLDRLQFSLAQQQQNANILQMHSYTDCSNMSYPYNPYNMCYQNNRFF